MDELSSHLQSHGLHDCDYWLTELEKLGVQDKTLLTNLEGNQTEYSKLLAKARNPGEKKALSTLLKVDQKEKEIKEMPTTETSRSENVSCQKISNQMRKPPHSVRNFSLENILGTPTHLAIKVPPHSLTSHQDNQDALALLQKLGLYKYYPKGLQLKDALCIKLEPLLQSLPDNSYPKDFQQLPYLILHKMMAYDSLCRSNLMPEDEEEDVQSDASDDSFQSFKSCHSSLSTTTSGIHPVDCLLSLIICSDDFLVQDLFSRLAKCQLAVPFIIPDPFSKELTIPLWCLRSIIKEWDCVQEKGEVESAHPVVSYKMPIVTFIRLGKHQKHVRSKSAILNEVISDSHYDHFFHRDCQGGSYELVLGEGLVDMCWYLPGETANAFSNAITFLNLHGDAREHFEQLRFLSQISFMFFILLTEEDLELESKTEEIMKQFGSSVGGITLLGSIKQIPMIFRKKLLIDLDKKNVFGIKDSIRNRIRKKLDCHKELNFHSIEDCCVDRKLTLLIDEHSEIFTQCFIHADELHKLIASNYEPEQCNVKDTLLPLQGESMWKAWAAYDKEMQRQTQRGNKSVNEYTEEIKHEKLAIRKMQLEHVRSLTPIMHPFIKLLRYEGSLKFTIKNFFLQCLKLKLDNLSRERISRMQYQYHSTRNELSRLIYEKNDTDDDSSERIEKIKKELEDLQHDIVDSSFGLEHLLRELSQVYEAALASHLYGANLCKLPQAAAEHLINGYPLELMDGDAAHVPIKWITAVLEEATKMLNDPNVFILSVLGLQSTGKSTLLNTVFGLQFNVSAGRCTRGAFMQLIPFDDQLREETTCSYLLVVDTEGLRAPQLDHLNTQKHDNELATFVIGLANMTLINIYGEVPGEMDDILQTSVHALLRMTQIKFYPSCQFVHHNAGVNVSSKVGRAEFTKKLNLCTIQAAKQEHCEEKFKCFSDVIKFDDQSDVHFFPGLWKGDPPMAPVNEGYSQSAQKLKLHIINILREKSSEVGDLHLSAFQIKVQDLWKALLKENFVFSFKNTQEIIAYNSLETEYSKWDWEFREGMLKWEIVAENEIKAAEIQSAAALTVQKHEELKEYTASIYEPLKAKMKQFFNGRHSDILAQWKAKFERRIQNRSEELKCHAKQHCTKLCENREAISKFEQDQKTYAAILTVQVQEYIANTKREQEQLSKSLERRILNDDEVKIIEKRDVFSTKKLKTYIKQGIITEFQAQSIQQIINECDGDLSLSLNTIIFGGVLGLEQVRTILTKEKQTEDELEAKFDYIWNRILRQLPCSLSGEIIDVEKEVEKHLTEFAQRQGLPIVAMLQERKSLREWGDKLSMLPKEGIHFVKADSSYRPVGPFVSVMLPGSKKVINSTTDPHLVEAVRVSEAVFDKAHDSLNRVAAQKTDFKPLFTMTLLKEVDDAITKESEAVKDMVIFNSDYRLTVFLIVCGGAILVFEKMARSFKDRTDPLAYLNKHLRKPLFTQFKNLYFQTEAKQAVADTLCALLEVPIKEQISKTIGAKIVNGMKGSKQYFSSKMALKVKILNDLHDEDSYDAYMDYVRNVKDCLKKRLKQYTIQYAEERVIGGTRLQIAVKEEVDRLITVVGNTVTRLNKPSIQEWLTTFSKDQQIVSELGYINVDNLLTGFDTLDETHLDSFKHQIRYGLDKLKRLIHTFCENLTCTKDISNWKDKPHDLLSDLIGCTEQCPFCGEQCDLLDPSHFTEGNQKHRAGVHRPSCLVGWRLVESKKMASDFCTSLVASQSATFQSQKTQRQPHHYNKYASVYPEWSIPTDSTAEASLYWKWFVARYSRNLAETYDAKPPEVPRGWHNIQWPEVSQSLNDALA